MLHKLITYCAFQLCFASSFFATEKLILTVNYLEIGSMCFNISILNLKSNDLHALGTNNYLIDSLHITSWYSLLNIAGTQ